MYSFVALFQLNSYVFLVYQLVFMGFISAIRQQLLEGNTPIFTEQVLSLAHSKCPACWFITKTPQCLYYKNSGLRINFLCASKQENLWVLSNV